MLPRRSFLSRLGIGVPAALGGVVGSGALASEAQAASDGQWKPARHAQDDWLDRIPGKHRLLFDTTTARGFGQALSYVSNYLGRNQSAYGLQDTDLAVVIVARHDSTPYAFNDAMWAKYGAALTKVTGLNDPNTNEPPTTNIYNTPGYGGVLSNRGVMLDGLLKRGVHLAVCEIGMRNAASRIAASTAGDIPAIIAELTANLLTNSHKVPAGIVTVNRAQERGYAFTYAAGV
jgi:intracellular sulfur oxidation DsrE/DsrF family protein